MALMAVASIHAHWTTRGNTHRVLWRADGRQRSLIFENLPSAERFKTLLEDHGPDEALRVIDAVPNKRAARFRISLARLSSRFSCSTFRIRWGVGSRHPGEVVRRFFVSV